MKKFIAMVLLLVVAIGCTTIYAFAAEGEIEQDVEVEEYDDVAATKEFDSVFTENRNRDNERAIQSVDSGAVVNPATIGNTMDVYDILTRIALVFTLISVVVLWIRHTIRDRKDPIKKYLR